MKLGIVIRREKNAKINEALDAIKTWEKSHSAKIVFVKPPVTGNITDSFLLQLKNCDALIAVGGDGTVLSAAHIALGRQMPIVGINAGRVGFLAEYKLEEIPQVLNALSNGNFSTQDRIMLDCSIYLKSKKILTRTVLNEIYLHAHAPQKMINLEVKINGKFLTEYWADSLMLATPTGSTAYSLAAGGPIIYPSAEAFVLTPVNPMSLSVRPLIIPSSSVCKIKCVGGSAAEMVFDGHFSEQLSEKAELQISRSKFATRFAHINSETPFPPNRKDGTQNNLRGDFENGFVQALREKLGWTGKKV